MGPRSNVTAKTDVKTGKTIIEVVITLLSSYCDENEKLNAKRRLIFLHDLYRLIWLLIENPSYQSKLLYSEFEEKWCTFFDCLIKPVQKLTKKLMDLYKQS